MDVIKLFVDEKFWENLMDMTNLHAIKVKETASTMYYAKWYKSYLSVM